MRHLDRHGDHRRLGAARRHQPIAQLCEAFAAVRKGSLADNLAALSLDNANLRCLGRPIDAGEEPNIVTHDAVSRLCSGRRDADQSLYWRSRRNSPLDLHRGPTHRGTRPPPGTHGRGGQKVAPRQAGPSGQSTNQTSREHVEGTGGQSLPDRLGNYSSLTGREAIGVVARARMNWGKRFGRVKRQRRRRWAKVKRMHHRKRNQHLRLGC